MSATQVLAGFSRTNRWLQYTSMMLAPAQFMSGLGNNCPSNLGFLAYNLFNQVIWYRAVKGHKLHALSLLLPHFNLVYAISYIGGITSGNVIMAAFLGVGTAGALTLNCACAWMNWMTNMEEGFGKFRFFFFGWRTLDSNWHTFICIWQVFDTIFAVMVSVLVVGCSVAMALNEPDKVALWMRYLAVPVGAAVILIFVWPNILWTELIVAGNHVESATDWIAVGLFAAQVGAMLMPTQSAFMGCFKRG
ncbi:hypothetical protein H2198_000769 [Neophaeococcomyces mojaviensis]|uniref:Uncharacterized protein n=1 Tax=Neophaeococcomyces mojaviensis TaxID=3383035 RepID=A0ACC3AIU5_9EURO|nr:hypothetical protein H2198_000769 [Knufia sp. JES_112]